MLARGPRSGKRCSCARMVMAAGIALLLAAPFFPAHAAAPRVAQCPPLASPIKLNFKTIQGPPKHSRMSLAGIANLVRGQGGQVSSMSRPVGLTTLKSMFSLKGATTLMPRGDGYCVQLASVEIDFGWEDMNVYVPTEFPEGSCEYRAVLDHENQHVSIIRGALREFAPRARARIEAVLARSRPHFSRGKDGSADAALAPVGAQLSALLQEFDELHSSRGAVIDTPSNYAAVTGMCKNWEALAPRAK